MAVKRILRVACPTCGSGEGRACNVPQNSTTIYHDTRQRLADQIHGSPNISLPRTPTRKSIHFLNLCNRGQHAKCRGTKKELGAIVTCCCPCHKPKKVMAETSSVWEKW